VGVAWLLTNSGIFLITCGSLVDKNLYTVISEIVKKPGFMGGLAGGKKPFNLKFPLRGYENGMLENF
jgi:hypothetical protein